MSPTYSAITILAVSAAPIPASKRSANFGETGTRRIWAKDDLQLGAIAALTHLFMSTYATPENQKADA